MCLTEGKVMAYNSNDKSWTKQEKHMDHREVGRMWDENAEVWTQLARMGYDVHRDYINTPAFLAMLPDVAGLSGLDVGCGEGHNTRLIADRGGRVTALDISKVFVNHALDSERKEPRGVRYLLASGVELPFQDESFDFVIAIMSLMDMPEHEEAVHEIYRVLKPGGFLQFSITHPCFQTPGWEWLLDETGRRVAMVCRDYFEPPEDEIEEWIFGAATQQGLRKFRIPVFRRTLSSWLNLLINTGFALERLEEPHADDEAIRECPYVADSRIIAYFLLVLCRKLHAEDQTL
jgi:ubiquinone/menaquinone biosynthesis C-methylase UbiE